MPDARIIVATHIPYWMPEDPVYLPVQVGYGAAIGFARDDIGENIARKNSNYCELTALYWAWKNVEADAIGLAHYRRHFAEPRARGDKRVRVLTGHTLAGLLATHDILLPAPRRYWIETNWSQYAHAHHKKDLILLRETVADRSPAYLDSFDRVMKRTWGHRFNMLVAKRPLLDAYAVWLFDLLLALEGQIDMTEYSTQDQRVYGFLGERLLDVWLERMALPYRDLPCIYMEAIHWPKKAGRFVCRAVRGRLNR